MTPLSPDPGLTSAQRAAWRALLAAGADSLLVLASRMERSGSPPMSAPQRNALHAACTVVSLLANRRPLPPALRSLETLEPSVLFRECLTAIEQSLPPPPSPPTPT